MWLFRRKPFPTHLSRDEVLYADIVQILTDMCHERTFDAIRQMLERQFGSGLTQERVVDELRVLYERQPDNWDASLAGIEPIRFAFVYFHTHVSDLFVVVIAEGAPRAGRKPKRPAATDLLSRFDKRKTEAAPPPPAQAPASSVVPAEADLDTASVVPVVPVQTLGESWWGVLSRTVSALAALPALAVTRGGWRQKLWAECVRMDGGGARSQRYARVAVHTVPCRMPVKACGLRSRSAGRSISMPD